MAHYAILAIGRDKKGVVATVTRMIRELGYTIETSHMALLGDQFSMMLVIKGKQIKGDALHDRLRESCTEHGDYKLLVTSVAEYDSHSRPEASHIVTVYCIERSGVISDVSDVLNKNDVNITHLHNHVQLAHDGTERCVVRAYVTMPSKLGDEDLLTALDVALNDSGASVKLEQLTTDPRNSG